MKQPMYSTYLPRPIAVFVALACRSEPPPVLLCQTKYGRNFVTFLPFPKEALR